MDQPLRYLLTKAGSELADLFEPVAQAGSSPALMYAVLARLGWDLDKIIGSDLAAFTEAIGHIQDACDAVVELTRGASAPEPILTAAAQAMAQAVNAVKDVDLARTFSSASTVHPDTAQALVEDVFEWLLLAALDERWPAFYQIALMLRVIADEKVTTLYAEGGHQPARAGDPMLRYPVLRPAWQLAQLQSFVAAPLALLERVLSELQAQGAMPTDPEGFLRALGEVLAQELQRLVREAVKDAQAAFYLQVDPLGVEFRPPFLQLADAGPITLPVPLPAGILDRVELSTVNNGNVRVEWKGLLRVSDTGDTTLLEVQGFALKLAGGGDTNALILRTEDGVLAMELRGRAALQVPLELLAGIDSGQVRAEGGAVLTYRLDATPHLELQSFVLSAQGVRLGGPDGLLIEQARLEIGELEFPLPPLSAAKPLPFDLTVSGKLVFPGQDAKIEVEASYQDGNWHLTSSGSVSFDNGVELLPVQGKPVLELEAQPVAGQYRFAAAGAMKFPQSGGAGDGQLSLSGALALQIVNRLPQVASFDMSARVENWQLSSDVKLRTLAVSLGYSTNRFTAKLAADIPFSDGFEVELLDAIPADLAAGATLDAGLVIERSGNRLDFHVTGGVRLHIPISLLSGGDDDKPVIAEAAGVFAFSTDLDVLPSLSNVSFALRAARLHLGGAGGLIVEDAALVATACDRLLAPGSAPYPTLAFSGKVICPVNAPEGEVALKLKGARFIFEHAGQLPGFEFANDGELGFESANLGGLPLEITQGAVRFKQGALPLPQLLQPDNLAIILGARLKLDFAGSAAVMGEIDRVTVEMKHGRPCLTLDGASAGVDNLSLGVMKMSGALGFHNLQDPLNIQLEGTLGGSMYGSGVKALVAIKLENGLPTPLGVCLDVSAGPSGIPLLYGFVIVGAAGGISYANSNADPCDFRTYTQSRKPISSGRKMDSKRPAAFDGCPCECPPPSLNILCQPHPDQDAYSGRVILKFSSIDEAMWSPIPLPGGTTLGAKVRQLDQDIGNRLSAATAGFDSDVEAQRAADAVVDGAVAAMNQIIPALDPANIRPQPPPEFSAQFNRLIPILQAPAHYWAEQMRRLLAQELAIAFANAKSGSTTGRPLVYDIVKQQLYRGVSCPDETLQVTGTFSYTGVSMFLSVTGGVNVSTAGSMGVIGYLNVLSIPIGQLRAFVTVTSDVGDPEPSLCGDLRFEFGPLYLGQISLAYRVPGCVTNVVGTVVKFGAKLGAPLLQRVLARIERANHKFSVRAGYDPARPETALTTLEPAEASQLVAQLLSDLPALTSADAAHVVQFIGEMAGDLWAGFNPRIELCGKVAPKLFGLPLGGELVQATGLIQKDHIEVQFGFSPMYLLGRVCPVADLFSGMDAARMGVAMSFPTVEQLLVDGLTGQYASQEKFEQYLNQGLARLLRDAVFTFSYQFFPLGMKLADGQGRAVMPYLTPHPKSTVSTWKNPDQPAPGAAARPTRRTVLFAALARGQLSDIHWTGAIKDVADLPPPLRDLQLQRDYFPHGGLLGAGKLQVPRLLWDAPPLDLLSRIFGATPWMDRLKALIELVRDWVLATREAGTLAFYIPAPNPPGPLRDAPGANLRQVIDSLGELDAQRLMPNGSVAAGDLYSLELAFFEGFLAGRLLGMDIGTADLYFVPPSAAGGASELHAMGSVSADTRLRQWVKEAKLEFVVSTPSADRALAPLDRKPIEQLFTDLLTRAQKASTAGVASAIASVGPKTGTGSLGIGLGSAGLGGLGSGLGGASQPTTAAPPAVIGLLNEAQKAMAERLPKVYLSAAVSLQVPAELAAFIEASAAGGAELRAYSPCYDPAAQGTRPDAVARRNGGLYLSGDLTFKLGALWQFKAKAQLAAYLPADVTQRARIVGQVQVGAVSGLKFLNTALPLGNAALAIDSDPSAGQPVLALRGELFILGFGQLRLEPLSGTVLPVALNAVRTGNAAVVSLTTPGARLRLPCLSTDTPLELRPAPGQSEIVLSSSGGSAALAAPNGLKLLAPNGAVLLYVSGAGSGSVQFDAGGTATLSVSLPVGLQASLFPGDLVLHRDFNLGQSLDVTLRSDGTFTVSAKLPPLVLENGLFTLHGAGGVTDPIGVIATQQGITLATPARFTLRVPNAAPQTAVLETLSLGVDGTVAASGSQAALQLPGLVTSSAGAFTFLRQGAAFRIKLTNVQLTFTALPLVTRWNVELGTGFFSATLAATGTLSCGFGTRLSIDAGQWAVQALSFQSLSISATSPAVKLFGTPLALTAGATIQLGLSSSGTVSGQLLATGAVTLMSGLLELGIQRITLSGGAAISVAVDGRLRALARPGGWVADVAMSVRMDSDQFETSAIALGTSLFASNELALSADLGFGRDASGLYLALKPLRVSYVGTTLVQVDRTLRANTQLTANWGAVTVPLPPFALTAASGAVALDLASQIVTLSLGAGQLKTNSTLWPAGTTNTPAIQCRWSGGTMTPGRAAVTLTGNDGDWQTGVPGVHYRLTQPSVRVDLALGAGAASSVIAGLTLTGARLQVETLAMRPDKQPWATIDNSLGDLQVGVNGTLTLTLPALSPGADPLKGLRDACENSARNDIKLPDMPSAPSGWRPPPGRARDVYDAAMSTYNNAVSDYTTTKDKLDKAIKDCGNIFPATPPAAASFGGATFSAEIKRLFALR